LDYSDTTVVIPVKNEPAVGIVAGEALRKLPGAGVIIIHKGALRDARGVIGSPRVRVMQQRSDGKGAAVREALRRVKTSIVCLIDGDATYSVDDLKKAIDAVRQGADLVLGNRFHSIDDDVMPAYVQFGNNILTATANILYGMGLHDSQTGLRAMRTDAIRALELAERGFGIEEEMNILARKAGLRIREIPISYSVRVGESKQFKPLDGVRLLLTNFKFLG
jgi:glycosyltransferase involved in cell wall biosynthesis